MKYGSGLRLWKVSMRYGDSRWRALSDIIIWMLRRGFIKGGQSNKLMGCGISESTWGLTFMAPKDLIESGSHLDPGEQKAVPSSAFAKQDDRCRCNRFVPFLT